MIKKVFPVGSKQFTFLKNVFSKFDRISIDNLEILFPFWCMLAFQHHLVKSYDISTFRFMDIDLDNGYIFSLVFEDWIGVISIILHSILLLWLMKKFDFFGPFRTVKIDFQTNFLLFTALYALLDIIIFGKMMFGFFLILLSLYILYRSQSFFSQLICLLLTIITLVFSLAINEPQHCYLLSFQFFFEFYQIILIHLVQIILNHYHQINYVKQLSLYQDWPS